MKDCNASSTDRLFTPVDHRTGERLEMRISNQDIPRGRRWQRTVVDLTTGKRYRAWSKSCGLPRCLCDAYVEEIKTAPERTPSNADGNPPISDDANG